MANMQNELHIRKKVKTYGKTKRKLIPDGVFNSVTQDATTNHTYRAAAKVGSHGKEVSFNVDISISNSRKSEIPLVQSKDVYDISSDEDIQNSEMSSLYMPKLSQQDDCSRPLQKNGNMSISRATLVDGRDKLVTSKFIKPQPRAKSSKLAESIDNAPTMSRLDEYACIRRSPEPFESNPDGHNGMDAYEQKVNAKKYNILGASNIPLNEKDLPNLKRKYGVVPSRTQLCKIGPRSLSSMSKILVKKEIDILNAPLSDEEMIVSESLPRRPTENSDLYTKGTSSPVAAKNTKNKKNSRSYLLDKKVGSKTSIICEKISLPIKNLSALETKCGNSASTLSHPAQIMKDQTKQKLLKTSPISKVKYTNSKSLSPACATDVMCLDQNKVSPKSHSIWKDLLVSANENEQYKLGSPYLAHSKNTISNTVRLDANLLKSAKTAHSFDKNSHQPRMIDSLAQKAKSCSFSDKTLIEESESDQEFHAISITGYVPHPKSRSLSVESEPTGSLVAAESQSSLSTQVIGPKFTYSRQRSMLAEEDLAKQLAFDLLSPNQAPDMKRNRRGSVPKLKPLASFHDKDEEENSQAVIRSVHELRKSGAIKRFVDECTDIFDRIGSPGKANSERRSGLLDLACKMSNTGFVQQFRANSMEQHLFVDLGEEKDIISGFLTISILIAVLIEGPMTHFIPLLCRNGVTNVIMELLDYELGIPTICKNRKTNMSKIFQSLIIEYHDKHLRSLICDGKEIDSLSPRKIALLCLKHMSHQSRENENFCGLFSEHLLTKLFAILKAMSSEESWESSNNNKSIDLCLVAECLQSHYMATCSILNESKWINEYLPLLGDVLELTIPRDLSDAHIEILKMILQVTNNNPIAIEVFVRPLLILSLSKRFVSQFHCLHQNLSEENFFQILDHLSLLLGVLMNFSEWSQRVGECFQGFEHMNEEDPLRKMIIIFEEHSENISQAESEQETLQNVVLGYLSVTLGFLFLYPPIGNRFRDKKAKLLACIEEFILIHRLADGKNFVEVCEDTSQIIELNSTDETHVESQLEAHKELTERLERLVKQLKCENLKN